MNFDVVRVNYIDRKALVYVLLLAPFLRHDVNVVVA